MEIPQMKIQTEKSVTFRPTGGVNLSKTPGEIADSQASGILNLYREGDFLRLRPGLCREIGQQYGPVVEVYPRDGRKLLLKRITKDGRVADEKYGVYVVTRKAILAYDGSSFERVPSFAEYGNSGWKYDYTDYQIDRCVLLPARGIESSAQDGSKSKWTARGAMVYLFGSGYFLVIQPNIIYLTDSNSTVHVTADYFVATRVPYVPVIYTDCKPSGAGTQHEARNFLTPRVTQTFTADNASTVFHLYDKGIDPDAVSAVYQNPQTGQTLDFEFSGGVTALNVQGMVAMLDRSAGTVSFTSPLTGASNVKNNLSVSYAKTVYSSPPVFKCHIGAWYGSSGDASGKGSRLFLSGNDDAQSVIYFSQTDNPDYFPEDALLSIGDPSDPVTAFGSQYNILVILKESGVYSLGGETRNDSFTVNLVHEGDGCDMPGSVQLVDNFLTWANSGGGLYTLRSTAVKDERTVYAISENIGATLSDLDAETLKSACSFCDGSYYVLFAGNSVILRRCEGSARSLPSDAQSMEFYLWKLPRKIGYPFMFDGKIRAFSSEDSALYLFGPDCVSDDGEWFAAGFTSKAFDFGLPSVCKRPTRLYLEYAGGNGTVDVCCGDRSQRVYLEKTAAGSSGPALIRPGAGWSAGISVGVNRADGELSAFSVGKITICAQTGAKI